MWRKNFDEACKTWSDKNWCAWNRFLNWTEGTEVVEQPYVANQKNKGRKRIQSTP